MGGVGLLREVTISEHIIIYGTGAVSDVLCCFLDIKGEAHKICAFATSKINGDSEKKRGYIIYRIDEAVSIYKDAMVLVAAQKPNHMEMEQTLKRVGCKNYYFIDPELLIETFYKGLFKSPIEPKKIFFMNYNGCGYGCNPKYIAKQLIEKKDVLTDIKMVWGVKKYSASIPMEIHQVLIGTLEYYRELATSGIWIDNARKTIDVRKREGQYYIQTWHGAAPMKKVERDIEEHMSPSLIAASKNDSKMADLFLSGSRFYSELYRKSFWFDGDIFEVGLPRQDVFWYQEEARSKVQKKHEIEENVCIVLYAPTFRDDFSMEAYDLDIERVKNAIEHRFNKECVLLVSKHPNNMEREYQFQSNNYIDVSDYDDFEELLAAADVLISDYSGCIYDFSCFTGKPVFLYQKDYDQMLEQRNFYIPVDEMPYPRAESMDELIGIIDKFDDLFYQNKLNAYIRRFGNFDDGSASEKVYERIKNVLSGGEDL